MLSMNMRRPVTRGCHLGLLSHANLGFIQSVTQERSCGWRTPSAESAYRKMAQMHTAKLMNKN